MIPVSTKLDWLILGLVVFMLLGALIRPEIARQAGFLSIGPCDGVQLR